MAQGHDGRSRPWTLKELKDDTPADHLSAVIQGGNEEEFVRILKTEATDLQNCLDSRGLSPLQVAVISGKNRMVSTLLRYRIQLKLDVNIRSTDSSQCGLTALEFAVAHGNRKAVRMLVKHGSDVRPLMEKREHKLCIGHRIHEVVCLCPSSVAHAFTNPPQSLKEEDIGNLVPDVPPKLLVGLLLSSKSIIQYKPAGCTDDRYCFPSYLQPHLPDSTWQNSAKYALVAGRFLTPVHWKMRQSVLHHLLVHVLEGVGEHACSCVSRRSFFFGLDLSECLVTFTKIGRRKGIMVCVRSRQFTINSMTQCCDAIAYITELAQLLTGKCLECAVVSTRDLRENTPQPHIYSTTEVAEARGREAVFLDHPTGVKESFCTLLLESDGHCFQEEIPNQPLTMLHQELIESPKQATVADEHLGEPQAKRMLYHPSAAIAASDVQEDSLESEWMCVGGHESSPIPTFRHSYSSSSHHSKSRIPSPTTCVSSGSHIPSATVSADSGFHTQSDYWSFRVYDTAVRKCCRELTQFIEPGTLLPALVEAGVFTLEEAAEIIRLPTGHTGQCLILLEKVASKGKGAYSALFQALRDESQHIPHHDLWETLVQKCEAIAASDVQEDSFESEWMYVGDHESSLTPTFRHSYGSSGHHSESGIPSLTPCASSGSHTVSADSGFHTQSQTTLTTRSRHTLSSLRMVALGRENPSAADFGPENIRAKSPIPPLHATVGKQTPKHQPVSTTVPSCDSIPYTQPSMYRFISVQHLKGKHNDVSQQNFDMNELYQQPLGQRQLFTIPDHGETDSDVELDPLYASKLCTNPITSSPINVPSRTASSASLAGKLPHSRRQSNTSDSTNTSSCPSSPSSNSSTSYLSLFSNNSPKDLSTIPPPSKWSLFSPLRTIFQKVTRKQSEGVDSPATEHRGPSQANNYSSQYILGYGLRM